MSEDIKKMPAQTLSQANSSEELFVESAVSERESAAKEQPQTPSPAPRSKQESRDADELKAITKAFAVHLAWSMAGLFNKK